MSSAAVATGALGLAAAIVHKILNCADGIRHEKIRFPIIVYCHFKINFIIYLVVYSVYISFILIIYLFAYVYLAELSLGYVRIKL